MHEDPLLVRRLDAALAKVASLGANVRAVYVTEADLKLLTRTITHRWRRASGSKAIAHPTTFRDHPLRMGKRTMIYTDHGVGVYLPRRA
jgi:hypothetical protein